MPERPPSSSRRWTAFAWVALSGGPAEAPTEPVPVAELERLGMAAAVHRALAMVGDPRAAELAASYRATLAHNVMRVGRIDALAEVLERAGITWTLMKGSALVTREPDWLGVRPMLDIDVLVDPRHYDRAAAAIVASGAREADLRMPIASRWACERALHLPDAAGPIEVDLHRGVHHWPLFVDVAAAALVRREPIGARWVPSPLDAVLMIAVHRLKSGMRGDARELLDARWYFARVEPYALASAADKAGLAPAVAWVLALTRRWFGDVDGDAARACALDERISVVRHLAVDASVQADATLRGRARHAPVFLDMYRLLPALTTHGPRTAAALALHVSLRSLDEVMLAVGARGRRD